MEWRNDRSNEGPPNRIFELGAKKDFLSEPNFVLAYIDFQLGWVTLGLAGGAHGLT